MKDIMQKRNTLNNLQLFYLDMMLRKEKVIEFVLRLEQKQASGWMILCCLPLYKALIY